MRLIQLLLLTLTTRFSLHYELSKCPLEFDSKQSYGYEQGFQLQVCCNVSSVKIHGFSDAHQVKISNQVAFQGTFEKNEDDIWSHLQLSKCSDKARITVGYVESKKENVTCQYLVGQTLNLLPNALPIPNWYVMCYERTNGCQACRLDILCDSEFSETCAEMSLMGSSPSATNSSIWYWVQVGERYPFEKISHIELTVRVQRTGELVKVQKLPAMTGKKQRIELKDLSPKMVYNVERCMVIDLPEHLLSQFNFVSKQSRLCVEEGYRTHQTLSGTIYQFPFFLLTVLLLF